MNRLWPVMGVLLAAGLLVAGCGRATVSNSGPPPPKPVVAVPFAQLKAGALDTVDFVSDTVGYVGGQGLILKSADGGKTWLRLYTTADNILAVDAVDETDVWASTRDYLLHATDGVHFQRVSLPGFTGSSGRKGIQAVDFVSRDQGFILADGTVWRLTRGNLNKATPPGPVDSLSFVDLNTGFAAGGNLVYQTADGGRTWHKVFTAPVARISWRAVIHASSADNAWLLLAGDNAMMSQQAYAVFHTQGDGFMPEMDEGNFTPLYPTLHVGKKVNIGAQPGPFAVAGHRAVFFTGWYPDQLLLTRTVDGGKTFTNYNIGHSDDLSVPDFFRPMGISFPDAAHGWLAGSSLGQGNEPGRGIILYTADGKDFKPVP